MIKNQSVLSAFQAVVKSASHLAAAIQEQETKAGEADQQGLMAIAIIGSESDFEVIRVPLQGSMATVAKPEDSRPNNS